MCYLNHNKDNISSYYVYFCLFILLYTPLFYCTNIRRYPLLDCVSIHVCVQRRRVVVGSAH